MQIQFIGVGEAFDEQYANTSVLVSLESLTGSRHVLLDCGFTAAAAYSAHGCVGADLDAVWISHFHGDHFLGLPMLLLRFCEENRTKPLILVGQAGVEEKVWAVLDLAYPTFRGRIPFPVHFRAVTAGQNIRLLDTTWSFAAGDHSPSAPCLALRLDHDGKSILYSGDGRPTPATAELAEGVTLLVHEAYGLETEAQGHGGVRECLALARRVHAQHLALVHIQRQVRRQHAGHIRDLLATAFGPAGILPEPGDVLDL